MNGGAIRLRHVVDGKQYYMVRCYTDEDWPWHQAIKYFPQRATDEELLQMFSEFIRSVKESI